MDLQQSIKKCFSNYAEFNGRAAKPEFWWFALFCFLSAAILDLISSGLSAIFSLATLLPSLAVGARRLHDINKSGWFQLIWLVPVLGWLYMIYLLVQDGDAAANQYGAPASDELVAE